MAVLVGPYLTEVVSALSSSAISTRAKPGTVGKPIGQYQSLAVDERPARIDDVRDISFTLFLVGFQQRVWEASDHAARVVEVEKDGADAIHAHRTDAMSQNDPTLGGLYR